MENIQGFITLNVYSLVLIIIIMIVFYSKKRLHYTEDTTYSYLLVSTILTTISGIILGLLVVPEFNVDKGLIAITNKIYLVFLFFWTLLLTFYTFYVSRIKKGSPKKYIKIFKIIAFIVVALILIFPIETAVDNSIAIPTGMSLYFTYIAIGICFLSMLILLLLDHNNMRNKKYVPIYLLAVLGSLVLITQIFTNLNYLINPSLILIITLMYFTIENPDMQMVEELNKNRKLTEQNFEEKSNFLFKISQDLKQPLKEITNLSQEIVDNKDIENNAKKINYNSKQLYTYVNSALDVSQMDTKNLKIIESTYIPKNFFEEIKLRMENELKDKNIEFRTNITKNLPNKLLGDNTKLKQVILSILFDSIRHTKNGFIELNVNTIIKYGVCRLLIEISDCGGGMELDKINNILNVNEELTKEDIDKIDKLGIDLVLAHKIIKVLNGNFIIKSEEGHGTNFLIIIDQEIEKIKTDNKLEKYTKKILNQDKILLISDDEELTNKITNKLEGIDIAISLYAKDAIEKLKSKKIKCIIIDNLKDSSAINVLKELNTSIPCIILIDNKEKFLSSHYIEDGFKDFMLKEYIEDEIRKIDKYL